MDIQPTVSDEELLERYQRDQNPDDFGILFERYYPLAFGAALQLLRRSADAEDLTMNVFEKLMKKLPTVEPVSNFKSYLYTAIRNGAYTYHRRGQSERQRIDYLKNVEKKSEEFVESTAFESLKGEYSEDERMVQRALASLREDQKVCLELFYYQNCSYQEIADRTKYDLGMVKSSLQNGKRNLRRELSKLNTRPLILLLLWLTLFF